MDCITIRWNEFVLLMRCEKCEGGYGHVVIAIEMDFPYNLCSKHRNFKPNKLFTFLDRTYFTYWTMPKANKRIYGDTYKEGLERYFRFKGWQMANHKGPYYK